MFRRAGAKGARYGRDDTPWRRVPQPAAHRDAGGPARRGGFVRGRGATWGGRCERHSGASPMVVTALPGGETVNYAPGLSSVRMAHVAGPELGRLPGPARSGDAIGRGSAAHRRRATRGTKLDCAEHASTSPCPLLLVALARRRWEAGRWGARCLQPGTGRERGAAFLAHGGGGRGRRAPRGVECSACAQHGDVFGDAAGARLGLLRLLDAGAGWRSGSRCRGWRSRRGRRGAGRGPAAGRRGRRRCAGRRRRRPPAAVCLRRFGLRAGPAGCIAPCAIRAVACARLRCDHLLCGVRRVKRWRQDWSSQRPFCPSIQP